MIHRSLTSFIHISGLSLIIRRSIIFVINYAWTKNTLSESNIMSAIYLCWVDGVHFTQFGYGGKIKVQHLLTFFLNSMIIFLQMLASVEHISRVISSFLFSYSHKVSSAITQGTLSEVFITVRMTVSILDDFSSVFFLFFQKLYFFLSEHLITLLKSLDFFSLSLK